MVKTYQFKTHCKGDIHSSKTANIRRQTDIRQTSSSLNASAYGAGHNKTLAVYHSSIQCINYANCLLFMTLYPSVTRLHFISLIKLSIKLSIKRNIGLILRKTKLHCRTLPDDSCG